MAFTPFAQNASILTRRFAALAVTACIITLGTWLYMQVWPAYRSSWISRPSFDHVREDHPINTLMRRAEVEWYDIVSKETTDLQSAVHAYRARRGRHPPPGFDKWFSYAQQHDAVIVEDFFDQIYHDTNPYWALDPNTMRDQARRYQFTVRVRNGSASFVSDGRDRPWMREWHNLTATIAAYLPDIDIPINTMDESRIVTPWEDINHYLVEEKRKRRIVPYSEAVTAFTLPSGADKAEEEDFYNPDWSSSQPFWDLVKVGCNPGSPSRNADAVTDFRGPPPMSKEFPSGSFDGYVKNWTLAKDICSQPELRESHGNFVEPISISTTHTLFPLFGGSKLNVNNEILLPAAMYWSSREMYSGGDYLGPEWEEKENKVEWRGDASGGRNREENWTRFHRHRFLAMLNGTAVQLAEENGGVGPNFQLPPYSTYKLIATRHTDLGLWLSEFVDVGFTNLVCFPVGEEGRCPYTDPFYEVVERRPMAEQYAYKYLPDIDGNSFSGRYRGFLRSTSLPIKATVYNEWHDSRLMPWVHFVPMHNSFVDIHGILDYFIGYHGIGGHDASARKIAMAGKEWAEKALRREDMQIYVYRLLLEYARLCDDQRERLGYVEDLLT